MSTTVPVPATGQVQILGSGQAARLTNPASSGTLYIGRTNAVTSAAYDFSVAAGGNRLQVGPAHAVGSVAITAFLEELPTAPTPVIAPATRFWAGGIAPLKAASGGGTNTTVTANTAYLAEVDIPYRCTLTGVGFLIGTTGGTNNAVGALYDSAGKVQAYSLKTGTVVGTANTYQSLAFVTPYEVLVPGRYFAGVMYNGTTATLQVQDGSAGTAGATSVFGGTQAAATDFIAQPIDVTPPSAVGSFPVVFTY